MTFKCRGVLYLSLSANLIFASLLALKDIPGGEETPAGPGVMAARAEATTRTQRPADKPTNPWRQLNSTNFHEFVNSLRLAACPEPIIRNLIAGAINRQFEDLMAPRRRIDDFWLDGEEKKAEERRRGQALVGLERKRQALIEEVLQIPWYQDPWADDSAEIQAYFGSFLTGEKPQKLGEFFVRQRFEAAATQVVTRTDLASPAGAEFARELLTRSATELAEVLAPPEIEELSIRMFQVSYFDVWKEQRRFGGKLTGTELREVLRILKPDFAAFLDLPDALKYAQPEFQRRIEKGNELRVVLGDERFAVFLQHHNGDFDQMPGHSDEGRPAPEVYMQMFELQHAVAAQLEAARQDEALAGAEHEALAANLLESAREVARGAMDAEAYQVYLKGGGRWLQAEGGSDAK